MKKEKLDEKALAILERGGFVSYEELSYLIQHFHRTDGIKDFGDVLRVYTTLYIPEPRCYCTIYERTGAVPDWTKDFREIDALFYEKNYEKVTQMIRERHRFFYFCGVANHRLITDYYRQYAYPRDYEMVFHDLSYWKTYSTLQELKEDYRKNGIPYFLEDPMNLPHHQMSTLIRSLHGTSQYHFIWLNLFIIIIIVKPRKPRYNRYKGSPVFK